MQLNITLTNSGFPVDFSGNLESFKDAIASSLIGNVDSSNLILGKVGGSMPSSDIGPWLDNRTWKAWNGSTYAPMKIVVGNATNQVTFDAAALTADRTITFPDKGGTLALTSDLNGGRETVIVSSNVIDWSLSNNFFKAMGADVTFSQINSVAGQEVTLAVVKTGPTNFTATFGSLISWPTGTQPAQTTWTAGTVTDLWIFKNVGGTKYGRIIGNYS